MSYPCSSSRYNGSQTRKMCHDVLIMITTNTRIQKRRSFQRGRTDVRKRSHQLGRGSSSARGGAGGSARASGRPIFHQSNDQNMPTTPTTMKGETHQPGAFLSRKNNTTKGVRIAPMAAPLWRMPLPMVRGSGGKMRWVVRSAEGQLPASNRPRKKRHASSPKKPVTKPVASPMADQAITAVG